MPVKTNWYYKILYLQALIEVLQEYSGTDKLDGVETSELFADGVYNRQMKAKAGMLIIGKRHKNSTTNYLMQGSMLVMSDQGMPPQVLTAPCMFVSAPMDKKVGLAITDVVWVNSFATTLTDVDDILALHTIADDADYYKELKGALTCQLDGLQLEQRQ